MQKGKINIIKAVYDGLTASVMFNGEKLKSFVLKYTRQGCPLSDLPLRAELEVLDTAVIKEKFKKGTRIRKEEIKL